MQSLCCVLCLHALQTALYIDCMTPALVWPPQTPAALLSSSASVLLSLGLYWTHQNGFSSCGPSDVLHQNQSLMRLTDLIRVMLIAGRVHQRRRSLRWSSVLLYMTENTCEVTQRLQKGKHVTAESLRPVSQHVISSALVWADHIVLIKQML